MGTLTKPLVLMALVGMLHWLFGNLYEAVVIAPNWVVDAPRQLERLHGFFVQTSPSVYFVPISLLAPLLVWLALAVHRGPVAKKPLRYASLFAGLASVLNAFIVGTIVSRLFGESYGSEPATVLHALCVRWNALNAVRMILTAATSFWLFAAFRALDRGSEEPGGRTSRLDSGPAIGSTERVIGG